MLYLWKICWIHLKNKLLWTKKYNKNHCTIEQPMSEDEIQKQKENGSCLTTHSTCVGVPLSFIEEIII